MKKFLIYSFIVFLFLPGFGQMDITIQLPAEDSGKIRIVEMITADSISGLLNESFEGEEINLSLVAKEAFLKENPVLKYIIYGRKGTTESTFAGEIGSVKIELDPNQVFYPKKSKFYKLTQLVNNFTGDPQDRNQIIDEIARLYKKYPASEYVQFIIYNSVKNNLISTKEIQKKFNLKNNDSYWINEVKVYSTFENE